MSRKIDPADQAVAYFATEPIDLARATLNRCVAVVKAREKTSGPRAVRKPRTNTSQPDRVVGQ